MSANAHAAELPAPTTTGIPNAKLAIWLFLASEVMLFSTLFTTYLVLRMAAPAWPRGWNVLNVPLATLNTIVLISSSVTIVMAYVRVLQKDLKGFRIFMGLTIFLACLFLVFKGMEYAAHFHNHEYPSTSIFTAVYFTLTGLHGLHVIGGIGLNTVLLFMANEDFDHPLFAGRVEAAGLYWHFVDIVWIFLFPALYLL